MARGGPNKGKGKGYAWIIAHLDYAGDDCLKWPFCISPQGRGKVGYLGKQWYAARLMCQLVHGDPPTPDHEAAHECGKGHEACMNPRHIFWKTQPENRQDSKKHGTNVRSRNGNRGVITPEQAEEIRALKGVEVAFDVAKRYGVHFNTIYMIWGGHTFKGDRKLILWTEEEDAKVRDGHSQGMTSEQIAKEVGRSPDGTYARMARLGLVEKMKTFTPQELADIRAKAEAARKGSVSALAAEYGVHRATISRVLRGETYRSDAALTDKFYSWE